MNETKTDASAQDGSPVRSTGLFGTWSPWGTEPKDGTEFLAYRPDAGVMECEWKWAETGELEDMATLFANWGSEDITADPPTHWMPMPPPPVPNGGVEARRPTPLAATPDSASGGK